MNDFDFNNFELPQNVEDAGARERVAELGVFSQSTQLEPGVSMLHGHQQGLGFRFFIHPVLNLKKSREAAMNIYDDVECVEFNYSRKRRPVLQCFELGHERLARNLRGEYVGGTMFEAYKRWKAGVTIGGSPLDRWGVLAPGEIRTLNDEGIFTIEQLASMPRDVVQSRFPLHMQDIFEQAIREVNGKQWEAKNKELAEQLIEEKEARKQLEQRLFALENRGHDDHNTVPEEIPVVENQLLKRGRGRPRKHEK